MGYELVKNNNGQIKMNDKEFKDKFDEIFDKKAPDFGKTLNIVVVGKVSTGKSSLINVIFGRDRDDPISPVGSVSGVTTEVTSYKFDDDVLITHIEQHCLAKL